jgi:hypothetical protein
MSLRSDAQVFTNVAASSVGSDEVVSVGHQGDGHARRKRHRQILRRAPFPSASSSGPGECGIHASVTWRLTSLQRFVARSSLSGALPLIYRVVAKPRSSIFW